MFSGQRLADAEVDALLHERGEALQRGRDLYGPSGSSTAAEPAGGIGDDDAARSSVAVFFTVTVTPGSAAPRGIDDGAFDDAGRGLRLGEEGKGNQEEGEREEHEGQTTHTGLLFRSRGGERVVGAA